MDITIRGLDELTRAIDAMPGQVQAAVRRGLTTAAKIIKDEAVGNAPRSPTQSQITQNLKCSKPTRKKGPNGEEMLLCVHPKTGKPFYRKRGRKANATSRAAPGGLERSITYRVWDNYEASVFVASNSEAGKYAGFIHDGTYNLGIGSVAKKSRGKNVGNTFIERAGQANEGLAFQKVEEELRKVLK